MLGIYRPTDSSTGLQLRAAGGEFNFGPLTGGLALWVSITDSTGSPPSAPFSLKLIAPSGSVTATYPAGLRQVLITSYVSPRRKAAPIRFWPSRARRAW